jgi:hypothetical protein
MPKGPGGDKRPADAVSRAIMVAKIATGEIEDERELSSAAAELGRKGGKARARIWRLSAARKSRERQQLNAGRRASQYRLSPSPHYGSLAPRRRISPIPCRSHIHGHCDNR